MSRAASAIAIALLLAGCSGGYDAGVTDVGPAHLMPEWKKWGAARALPDAAAPRRISVARAIVRRAHAQPVIIRLYRVRDGAAAPAIVVASFTPRRWLKTRARRLLEDLQAEVGLYGPCYVGLVDRTGRFVWETGRAMTATGPAGGVYAPREIDSCEPVAHSQLVGAPPPPCTLD